MIDTIPILTSLLLASANSGPPLLLDDTKQLFLDNYLIESMDNVERKIQQARKFEGNPVLTQTENWEGPVTILYGSVLREDDGYRMWYYSKTGVCYAESEDGIQWEKPALGVVTIDGHETNVLLKRNPEDPTENPFSHFYELFGVHKNPNQDDPSRRYLMGVLSIHRGYEGPRMDPFHRTQRRGLGVAGSPDGIHWTAIEDFATDAICDGGTHWLYDLDRRKYMLYGRTKFISPDVKEAWSGNEWFDKNFWGRSVAYVESDDFVHWNYTDPATAPVVMTSDPDDPVGTEIYSMQVFKYEDVYIGLVQAFYNQAETCHLDLQLAVSRDGVAFERVGDRTPFIPVGPVGSWDRFNTSPANNPPIEDGDQLRFYFGGRTYRHSPYNGPDKGYSSGGIGFASIPRDRFVSLQSSFDGGTVVTKPVEFGGSTLHLNAKADYGEISVEVLDANEKAVATSLPISEDGLDIPVKWGAGETIAHGEAYVLRIQLKNAKLFALWCE